MPKSEDSSTTPRQFPCSWQEIFDETQWGTSVPTKIFLWNNPGVYVDYGYPDPEVPHFKGAWTFLGSPIQTVLPGELGEHVFAAISKAAQSQKPVIGTYSLTIDDRLTTIIIRFLPLHRHVLGLVHDFTPAHETTREAEALSNVSADLIQPITLHKGPFSQSGIPRITVSIPLHGEDTAEGGSHAQNVEETFIKNLASSFQLDVTNVSATETRSFDCSGPLPMISKFLVTLKALFPPESAKS
ncbi:MAG: hypothetical protein NPIRA02_00440 [Nitrospirales bacterium]|nr:MAG: hypothetical protein NPIRA02_00440 [Nitrospirales bacterium]